MSKIPKLFTEILKFNPYHDRLGRFTTSGAATSFTYAPGKSKAHDLAIEREKQTAAAGMPTPAQEKTLKGIESRTRNLKNEQLRVVDGNGDVIMQKRGDSGSVIYTVGEARENFKGNITIHNHPDGGTFSTPDITQFGYGAKEIRAASPEGTYILRNIRHGTKYNAAKEKTWYDMREDLESAEKEFKQFRTLKKDVSEKVKQSSIYKEYDDLLKKWVKGKDSGADPAYLQSLADSAIAMEKDVIKMINDETRKSFVNQYHEWYKKNAHIYGFEYSFNPTKKRNMKKSFGEYMFENLIDVPVRKSGDGDIVLDRERNETIDEISEKIRREIMGEIMPPWERSLPSDELRKFNPYHDRLGRFASAGNAASFTYAPGKSKAHDKAIEREKQRTAAAGGGGSGGYESATTGKSYEMPKLESKEAEADRATALRHLEKELSLYPGANKDNIDRQMKKYLDETDPAEWKSRAKSGSSISDLANAKTRAERKQESNHKKDKKSLRDAKDRAAGKNTQAHRKYKDFEESLKRKYPPKDMYDRTSWYSRATEQEKKKLQELDDARVFRNKRGQWQIAKSFYEILNEQKEESREFSITKADHDKRLVFGWANVAIRANGEQIEDLQGDIVEPEDLEGAVYEYVLDFRDGGEEHIPSLRKKARMVESVIFTEEKLKAMGIPVGTVPLGWWIGFYVDDDEAWSKIKDGTYTMFSVEGKGVRHPVKKSAEESIEKFNPYHDRLGRFASAGNAASFTYAPGKSKAHDKAIEREKQRTAAAGGGGSAQTSERTTSRVFVDEEPVQISSTYRIGRNTMWGSGYYTKDVYEAKDDGEGGISLSRANPTNIDRRNNGNTEYEYNLKNGLYPNSNSSGVNNSVGINWDNVKSVSGDTFNSKDFLREKGFRWNRETKRYEKGGSNAVKNGKLTISGDDFPDDLTGVTVITGNTYQFRNKIKDAGFKWNPSDKTWVKKGLLFEEITKGYTLEVVDDENVVKSFNDILKFNPYHDRLGRFTTGGGFMGAWDGPADRRAVTFSANPGTKAGAMAIARESGKHETIGRAYGLDAYKPKEKPKAEKPKAEKPKVEKPKVEKPKAEKPKETSFKAAATKAEAVKYAKEKLGVSKVSYGSKLDLETINHVNEQITKVYERHPDLKGSLNEIKTTTKKGTYAYAQTLSNGEMKLAIGTTIYGKGMNYVKDSYQRDVQSGFHPKGTNADAIIIHEMGHIYNYMKVRSSTGVAANTSYDNMVKYANDLNRRTTAKKWLQDAASSVGKSTSDFSNAISKYAGKNAAEAFAEAFAEFNNSPNPRPECIALMKAAGILK